MNNFFLKCDISGIQSFIFNVPSNGAARALKSRSVFVKNIADDCLIELKNFFGTENTKELYNGGGNFYLEVSSDKNETDVINFIKTIDNQYLKQNIFPYIAFIEKNGRSISDSLDAVNKKIQKAKMQRPIYLDLLDAKPITVEDVDINSIKGINGQVPKGDFSDIAEKSEGDQKLAALKLDVDNLGSLFRDRTEDDYSKLSKALTNFFDGKLLQLIKDLKMQQNIYVVFSGGDDCFLIGTWEKVFELAIILRQRFAEFQKNLKREIISLPDKEITFSAGIIVFQPHFPMIQLAEEAEEALSDSKRVEGKNSVTVFGKTLTWKEFEQSQKLAETLTDLINNKEESKSLVMILRLVYPQKKKLPKVWQLKYYLKRNVKSGNISTVKQIFDEYSKSLLFKHLGVRGENPDIYLVASRWAEFFMK
jgi:CRISPR-associated protein Csm1